MRRHVLIRGVLLAALFALGFVPSALFAQSPPGLFIDAPPATTRAAVRSLAEVTIRHREVSIDLARFQRAAALDSRSDRLTLNLFPGVSLVAERDRVDAMDTGIVWVGHILGIGASTVSLSVSNSMMQGVVLTPTNTFVIRPTDVAGVHAIDEIDQSRFRAESDASVAASGPEKAGASATTPTPTLAAGADADDGSVIDVMVLYTPAAETAAGGSAGMVALINNAVSLTNTAFANSNINPRLRLVYSGSVAYTEQAAPASLYGDYVALENGSGTLSGVAALRDAYRADLVSLFTSRPSPTSCDEGGFYFGPGAFDNEAFSAVEQSCAIANLGFLHGIGRNMGAGDEWYADSTTLPYPHSHGYVSTQTTVRTIDTSDRGLCQALGISCTRIPYWSNPGLTYNGGAIGVPAGTNPGNCYDNLANPPCEADNHRTINDTAYAVANFRPPALTIRRLSALQSLPAWLGTTITWTAYAVSGTAPVTYQFWVYNGTSWSLGQDWSTSNVFDWTPAAAGTYTLEVWARNAGSTDAFDARLGAAASIKSPSPPVVSLSSVQGPLYPGIPHRWSAYAGSGSAPYQYKFWLYDGTAWAVLQDWSPSSDVTWAPPRSGTYFLQVWVRNAGSTAPYDGWAAQTITIVDPPAPIIDSFTIDSTGPFHQGSLVRLRTSVHGGVGPYSYTFYVFDGSTWSAAHDAGYPYTQDPSMLTWFVPATGSYTFQVWVKNAGSGAGYDAWAALGPIQVVPSSTPAVASLLASRTLPSFTGVPITFDASAFGISAPVSYRFYLFDGSSWTVVQDWSASQTWTWTPVVPGTYTVQVWANDGVSGAAYLAWAGLGPFEILPQPPPTVSVSANVTPPSPVGSPMTFTATATGGIGPYDYTFYLFDGTSWVVGQQGTLNTWIWNPTAAGTYTVQVWVRNAGSTAAYDGWAGLGPFTITP